MKFENIVLLSLALTAAYAPCRAQVSTDVAVPDEAPVEVIDVDAYLPNTTFDARSAFLEAPSEIMPMLDPMMRLDMCEYFDNGLETPTINRMGEKSRVTSCSDDEITIAVSPEVTYTFTVLHQNNPTQLAITKTLDMPTPMSFVMVYNVSDSWEWKEAQPSTLMPPLKDWTTPEAKKVMADIENTLPFVSFTAKIDPATKCATLTNTLKSLLNDEDYAKVKPYIRDSITYKWTGKKWALKK